MDIGCGTNRLIRTYHGDGVGVDVHPWDGVDVIVENSADLPFESESIDTVSIVAALNHIPNRGEVLREAHRLLRPGGKIVITMLSPRISWIWHHLRGDSDADQRERNEDEGEVYGISPRRVESYLSAAGYDKMRSWAFMLGLNRITIGRKP